MRESSEIVKSASSLEAIGNDLRWISPASGPKPLLRAGLAHAIVGLLAGKRSVLMVGASGSGKTMLARSLCQAVWPSPGTGQLRLVSGADCPPIVETHAARFVEQCWYADHLENKMGMVMSAARSRDAVLFIDETDACLGTGASSNNPEGNIATLLTPHIANGVRVLGATTPQGLARMRTRNPRFLERFELVEVPEPDVSETESILRTELTFLALHSGATVSSDAAGACMALARRYMQGNTLVSAVLRLARLASSAHGAVNPGTLRRSVAATVGLRDSIVGAAPCPGHEELVAQLSSRIYGQDVVVSEVADTILTFAGGLSPAGRPIGAFLLVGPSGTGKTSLAIAAAEALTGDPSRLIRLDMSEFGDPFAARRLLDDTADSLVGQLTSMPAGVVLLDEIEKAHVSAVRVMLAAIGEARLTSESGRTVRLDNHLVMFTSNVGSSRWNGAEPIERIRQKVMTDCAEFFSPEFRSRLTQTLLYSPLSPACGRRIVERDLESINWLAGLADRGLHILWSADLPSEIARLGVSHQQGARGLQRVIRTVVVSPLARWLAAHPEACDGVVMLQPHTVLGEVQSVVVEYCPENSPLAMAN
jgi:ATP-dependent Clp protease ATP-binding subunit ClpC